MLVWQGHSRSSTRTQRTTEEKVRRRPANSGCCCTAGISQNGQSRPIRGSQFSLCAGFDRKTRCHTRKQEAFWQPMRTMERDLMLILASPSTHMPSRTDKQFEPSSHIGRRSKGKCGPMLRPGIQSSVSAAIKLLAGPKMRAGTVAPPPPGAIVRQHYVWRDESATDTAALKCRRPADST